jgi:signal peptidase I
MLRFPWQVAVRYAIGLSISAILLHTFCMFGLVSPVAVSGSSMHPTLREGERLLVDRTAFFLRGPRRGELVVFRCPDRANEYCVKRVFGLPGDRVALTNGELQLNPQQDFATGQRNVGRVDRRFGQREPRSCARTFPVDAAQTAHPSENLGSFRSKILCRGR